MRNPFFDLQARVAELLAPVFPTDPILTEQLGDLPQQVERLVMELGFGLVVTTAKGTAVDDAVAGRLLAGPLGLREELTVAIIHNPLLNTTRNALETLHTVLATLHGQPAQLGERSPVIKVLGHEVATDVPDGLVVHHVRIGAVIYL